MPKNDELAARAKAAIGAADNVSMNPFDFDGAAKAKTKKEKEKLPDMREVVADAKIRLKLLRLTALHAQLGAQESVIKKDRARLGEEVKAILCEIKQNKLDCDGVRVVYFSSMRNSIKANKLLALGVAPATITAATDSKEVYTLKITAAGAEEEEE